jgi:para-aminobenzoate synthetase
MPMDSGVLRAGEALAAEMRRRASSTSAPFVVALDGPSGSGKSTVAAALTRLLDAVVVSTDEFFAAEVPSAAWDAYTPAERAAWAIRWRRVKAEALNPLRADLPAQWFAFDFSRGARADGTYAMETELTKRSPSRYVVLDGTYSTRPELLDSLDLTVLVDAPNEIRHARLRAREATQFLIEWHSRWDAAEEYYFTTVRPRGSFDLVVTTATAEESARAG